MHKHFSPQQFRYKRKRIEALKNPISHFTFFAAPAALSCMVSPPRDPVHKVATTALLKHRVVQGVGNLYP